jgi:hypothetical protein
LDLVDLAKQEEAQEKLDKTKEEIKLREGDEKLRKGRKGKGH